jgi:hypothetical protein
LQAFVRCEAYAVSVSTERTPYSQRTRRQMPPSSTIKLGVLLKVGLRASSKIHRVVAEWVLSLKHWCHPCTVLKVGGVCITRQCQVVFTLTCQSVCLSAPCLEWFEVRHRHTPCNEGCISINDYPQIGVRVGHACESVASMPQS